MFSIRLSCRDPHIHRLSLNLTQRTDTSPSLIVVKTFIQSNTLIVHEALGRFKKQKVVRITCNCSDWLEEVLVVEKKSEDVVLDFCPSISQSPCPCCICPGLLTQIHIKLVFRHQIRESQDADNCDCPHLKPFAATDS